MLTTEAQSIPLCGCTLFAYRTQLNIVTSVTRNLTLIHPRPLVPCVVRRTSYINLSNLKVIQITYKKKNSYTNIILKRSKFPPKFFNQSGNGLMQCADSGKTSPEISEMQKFFYLTLSEA
jgi:hypothetical protein